ncbi:IclR family transcriptional regulator [Bordetella genomosp. 13]|uniref:IclR family transcriptional regulator n=1 Tax=Bordetella genomosp. 13 TaxID=463040 RepID=UPI00119F7CB1|nr:IclR family transcriptional regulator [Bordetella genomosp. 13]
MPQIVPAAQRVLQVFEVYARERRPLTNSEMARYLDLADSSCSDLMYTLRQAGYLLRTPKSRVFHPTSRLLDIARANAGVDPLRAFAEESLDLLTSRSGETSMCAHIDGDKVKIFASQESSRALRYVLRPGTVVDIHTTALGKALLGAMADDDRNALIDSLPLPAVTSHSIVDREVLRAQIEQGRRDQYFVTRNEGNEGVFAIGISGEAGGRLTAMSIVGPTHRMEKNFDEMVRVMQGARAEFFGTADAELA